MYVASFASAFEYQATIFNGSFRENKRSHKSLRDACGFQKFSHFGHDR